MFANSRSNEAVDRFQNLVVRHNNTMTYDGGNNNSTKSLSLMSDCSFERISSSDTTLSPYNRSTSMGFDLDTLGKSTDGMRVSKRRQSSNSLDELNYKLSGKHDAAMKFQSDHGIPKTLNAFGNNVKVTNVPKTLSCWTWQNF